MQTLNKEILLVLIFITTSVGENNINFGNILNNINNVQNMILEMNERISETEEKLAKTDIFLETTKTDLALALTLKSTKTQ